MKAGPRPRAQRQEPGLPPRPFGWGWACDVSMIESDVEVLELDALPGEEWGDRFASTTGFNPRSLTTPYRWFRVTPRRVQAWREVDELVDRQLMRGRPRWGSDSWADREGRPTRQMEPG